MDGELTAEALRGLRLRSQRLTARRSQAAVAEVVAEVFALQAQDDAAATLGIWARGDALSAADVAFERDQARSIVRTWCLRGTLHLVNAHDVRWLLDLLRPTLVNANRTRRAQLGLDDAGTATAVRALVEMLASAGPLARGEIAQGLAERGIPSEGQATIHVLWRAALDGLVCCGPDRNGTATFVLLDDWVQPATARGRESALAELARRYVQAYGPARPTDLAAWSGLPERDARHAWALLGDELIEVPTRVGEMWTLASRQHWLREEEAGHALGMRLLPAFDGLWLGYRDRELLLPVECRAQVYPGGGVIRPSVLVDGRPAGTWTRRVRGSMTDIVFQLWETLEAPARDDVSAAVADLGRFLDRPTRAII